MNNPNKYLNEIYDTHKEIDNVEKLKILDDVDIYMRVLCSEMDMGRGELIKKIFANEVTIADDIIDGIQKIIESHYRIIIKVGNISVRNYNDVNNVNDVIWYGVYGIYRGVLNYDARRNEGEINVCSYLWRWVKVYISKGSAKLYNTVQLPSKKVNDGVRISMMSMDGFASSEDSSPATEGMHHILTQGEVTNGDVIFTMEDLNFTMDNNLTLKEQYVIKSLFGLDNMELKTVSQLSDEYDVTVQMIYSYRNDVLAKLRRNM